MTRELKLLIRQRHVVWYKLRCQKTSGLKSEYTRLSKVVKREKNKLVREYENKIAMKSKHDPKLIYSYVKSKQGVKDQVRALIDSSGQLVHSK